MIEHCLRPRRILVTLEDDEAGGALFEAAARLAEGLQAELVGLFVEDVDLLDAAALPGTRSVPRHAQAHAPLDAPLMRRALKISAGKARAALAAAAQRRRVHWSFQVARGILAEQVLAVAQSGDLLALGLPRRAMHQARLGVAVRRVADQAPCSVLIVRTGERPDQPAIAVYEGSERALVASARITQIFGWPLIILAVADSAEAASSLEREAAQWAEDHLPGAHVRALIANKQDEIREALIAAHPSVVVLDQTGTLAANFGIELLVKELPCSVFVLR